MLCCAVFLAVMMGILGATTSYTDCCECNSLIEAKLQGCEVAPCVLEGGSTTKLQINFKSAELTSGKAKLCLTHLSDTSCDPEVASIRNICDHIKNRCRRSCGRSYIYNTFVSVPDVQMNYNATYKLYDDQCVLVACVRFPISVRSTNTNPLKFLRVGENIPCPT